ncbi:uncharacterized protein LOC130749016 [Lotus japonicus]|uniref:uncharacterized protein LOC130749016 n=1 Tax=Lotus japonicus TaxID=34305 RepID=UPI0025907E15|nr:uncharacterized protein LOC130749016 [Lotus japonicus]
MDVDEEGAGEQHHGAQPAGKPPEEPARRPTFKEKVLGAKKAKEAGEFVNLVEKGSMRMEFVEDNTSFPMFSIEPNMYKEICKPWEDCLVVKLLGKHIGYRALCEKLRMMWKMTGGYEVRDVHHGYFLVKFEQEDDKAKAISGAPWLIYDHYLAVKPWTPDFVAANSKISTTVVWIRIPGIGFQFYDRNILLTLASAVGTPIKIDMNTNDMQRGRYARICVEIDLTKPVLGVVGLEGIWYNIEYDGLHLLCRKCGCYGHLTRNCTTTVSKEPSSNGEKEATAMNPNAGKTPTETEGATPSMDQQNSTPETLNVTAANVMQESEDPAKKCAKVKSQLKCPYHAHGDWLVVEKRKKKVNAGLNGGLNGNLNTKIAGGNSKYTTVKAPKSVEGIKGAGQPLQTKGKSECKNGNKNRVNAKSSIKTATATQVKDNNSIVFNAKVIVADSYKEIVGIAQGKKRMRKEVTIGDGGPQPSQIVQKIQNNSSSSTMLNGTRIYVVTDGTQSTMPLVAQGGN